MRAVHVVALAGLTLTGCARVHARAEPIIPPLETPQPPPRVIAATLPATATTAGTAEAPPADPPTSATQPPAEVAARRPSRGATAPAARQEKPESPAAASAPAPAPARPPTPGGASPTLQTTTNVGDLEQKVRATLAQASRDLVRIDVRALNAEARAQFEIAKRFVQQAGDALTAKNFVFAGQLADKAAALAALLLPP